MKYSIGFKESVVRKVLPPSSRSILSVAKETGVAYQTITNWLKLAKDGTLTESTGVGTTQRPAREKFNLVIESQTIPESDKGKWLRENGLHSEHIPLFEQELRELMEQKTNSDKDENKRLLRENKRLQKELDKKEKALAELAALYTLKKKAEAIWGEDEED